MSEETARFLLALLDTVQLSAKDPDLVKNAQAIAKAQLELHEFLARLASLSLVDS